MLEKTPAAVGHALEGLRAGLDKTFWADRDVAAPESMAVTSDAFSDGAQIPIRFTADAAKTSPSLAWSGAPANSASVALIVEDPDSPTPQPFIHLLALVDAAHSSLPEGAFLAERIPDLVVLGHNSMRKLGWLPPDPPTGHGEHRYLFQVYALDYKPDLDTGAEKHDFERALRGHVVARGKMIGTYGRAG